MTDAKEMQVIDDDLPLEMEVDFAGEVIRVGGGGADGVGIESVKQTTTSTEDNGINVVTVTLTNGQKFTFQIRNGSKGSKGDNGKSAYEIAVDNGFEGTEQEWLDSLKASGITLDNELSLTSENAVKNKVVTAKFNNVDQTINGMSTFIDTLTKSFNEHKANYEAEVDRIGSSIGNISSALNELHEYAEDLKGGEAQ